MKKILLFVTLTLLCLSLFSQQVSQESFVEESLVINVEVPVRVFKGKTFIDDLTLKDFEILEDGIPQKIEAVYLVKKKTLERSEERTRYMPDTSRNFYVFFEISEYSAKLGEAIDYFVQDILLPGDNLIAITSLKTYKLRDQSLRRKEKEEIAEDLKGLIKRDCLIGDSEYRHALKELEGMAKILSARIVQDTAEDSARAASLVTDATGMIATTVIDEANVGVSLEPLLTDYAARLQKMETLRKVDELRLLDFAKHLKGKEGQKYVFIFYQREFIPQIDRRILMEASGFYDGQGAVDFLIADITNFYTRELYSDVKSIKQAFADSATSIHFMYLSTPRKQSPGVYFAERSYDVFSSFAEIAKASGGFMGSSANPFSLFQEAVNSSENYYLLYFAPKDYAHDGKFKKIEVRVKNKNYKVIHRIGYYAD
jgi:VWFA-related protein